MHVNLKTGVTYILQVCFYVHLVWLHFLLPIHPSLSLQQDFHRHASLLFRLLSDVKSHHHSPHLSQMMLRIDYNKFFSSSCSAVVPFPAGTQKTETAVHPH